MSNAERRNGVGSNQHATKPPSSPRRATASADQTGAHQVAAADPFSDGGQSDDAERRSDAEVVESLGMVDRFLFKRRKAKSERQQTAGESVGAMLNPHGQTDAKKSAHRRQAATWEREARALEAQDRRTLARRRDELGVGA